MQPHSAAAITVIAFLSHPHNYLKTDSFGIPYSMFYVRTTYPRGIKVHQIEIESFWASEQLLKLRVGRDFACHLSIRFMWTAREISFIDHSPHSSSLENFRFYLPSRIEGSYISIPKGVSNTRFIHQIEGRPIASDLTKINYSDWIEGLSNKADRYRDDYQCEIIDRSIKKIS